MENEWLLQKTIKFHEESGKKYGSPGIYEDFKEADISCSLNRVARIIKINNIQAKNKRKLKPVNSFKLSFLFLLKYFHIQLELYSVMMNGVL